MLPPESRYEYLRRDDFDRRETPRFEPAISPERGVVAGIAQEQVQSGLPELLDVFAVFGLLRVGRLAAELA